MREEGGGRREEEGGGGRDYENPKSREWKEERRSGRE